MKFQFKIQDYQSEAVENTVRVFKGQPADGALSVPREAASGQLDYGGLYYRNAEIRLGARELLANIRAVQRESGIPLSRELAPSQGLGACALDIEMETGTGKTYVYIKTIFELYKHYGWSRFIVIVPSIAIREGVKKSFAMLEEHFMELYRKKLNVFVYDSGNLTLLNTFADGEGIAVMIINTQAFAASLKEGGRSKESLIIYSERDSFQSRRPIDAIASTRPIIIMDEPQKMEGEATRKGLKAFDPLFALSYSATHKTRHNTVYALDALDAYRKRLVKRIEVKGIELKNLKGTSGYLYLDSIILSKDKPPAARVELEIKRQGGVKRELRRLSFGDDLFAISGLGQYRGFVVSEIDPLGAAISFLNGETLRKGEVRGDAALIDLQRVQIRETIRSHLEKEAFLFGRGIKALSLFFIDKVANYKSYNAEGKEEKGPLQKIFEEEYLALMEESARKAQGAYKEYLCRFPAERVHSGYFSIDKRTSRAVDSKMEKKAQGLSDDISAYDLILKDKERLLSLDEPVRFIFSHSALREGWDNPNVFQICALRHSFSDTGKRQEVGRGLRLCVDGAGRRMDCDALGEEVHEINRLTVVAGESYASFTAALQGEVRESLRERPKTATQELFRGKIVLAANGERRAISENEAALIHGWLYGNGYIDEGGFVTEKYKEGLEADSLAPFPERIEDIRQSVNALVRGTFDESAFLAGIAEDGNRTKCWENSFNEENCAKGEFKELWESINRKYAYTVLYESAELVEKAVSAINRELSVAETMYIIKEGKQEDADRFEAVRSRAELARSAAPPLARHDLAGDVAKGARVTRRTAAAILKGISREKLLLFRRAPEEFALKVSRAIREQKAAMIVEHVSYRETEGRYSSAIFMQERRSAPLERAYAAKKHVMSYVFPESEGERKFAESLDIADEVSVYAKLPRAFKIPTPVGNYSPDWAIAFNLENERHVFFVAETKGSMQTMELRGVEQAKIECAERLFNGIEPKRVRYRKAKGYQDLLDAIRGAG